MKDARSQFCAQGHDWRVLSGVRLGTFLCYLHYLYQVEWSHYSCNSRKHDRDSCKPSLPSKEAMSINSWYVVKRRTETHG